jgi:hypothetical protein
MISFDFFQAEGYLALEGVYRNCGEGQVQSLCLYVFFSWHKY